MVKVLKGSIDGDVITEQPIDLSPGDDLYWMEAEGEDGWNAPTTNRIHPTIEHATAHTELDPSLAKIAAGNYKKGKVNLHGLIVTIENPKGSVRRKIGGDGKPWERTLAWHYGYFNRTLGADGDHVDCFVGPNPNSEIAFVVDQVDKAGVFDESKVMLGFDSLAEAKAGYLANYPKNWTGLDSITPVTIPQLRQWLAEHPHKDNWSPITENVHDVSKEARDDLGQWVSEGGSVGVEAADENRMEKEKPQVSEKIQRLLEKAKEVEYTDDRIEAGGDVGSRDWDEIEKGMSETERRRMDDTLESQKQDWIDGELYNYDASDDVDRDEAANAAGWGNSDIRDKARDAVDNIDNETLPDDEERESALDAIEGWHNHNNGSGADGIDDLVSSLVDDNVDQEAVDAVRQLRDTAESEIEDALQSQYDDLRDSRREDIENDYDDTEARNEYLSNFYENNEERYSGEVGEDNLNKWGRDSDGDHSFIFDASFGEQYTIWVSKLDVFGVKADHIGFRDSDDSYKITGKAGAAGAAEVFRKVTTAVAAFVLHEKPEFITFSAAEKSRSKLYDHLTRTICQAFPEYRAIVGRKGDHSQYGLIRRDQINKFEKSLAASGGKMEVETLVNSRNEVARPMPTTWKYLNPAVDLRWFDYRGWLPEKPSKDQWDPVNGYTHNVHDVSQEPRDASGEWTTGGTAVAEPEQEERKYGWHDLDDDVAKVKFTGKQWPVEGAGVGRVVGPIEENTWYKDGDDHAMMLSSSNSGQQYRVYAAELASSSEDGKEVEIVFTDHKGSVKVTGGEGPRGAAEVFRKISAACAAYLEYENVKVAEFSAAEPSRQRLYDRLVKTLARQLPDYKVLTIKKGTGKIYMVVDRKYYEHQNEESQGQAYAGADVLVNAEAAGWFNPSDWSDGLTINSHDVTYEKRDASGKWVTVGGGSTATLEPEEDDEDVEHEPGSLEHFKSLRLVDKPRDTQHAYQYKDGDYINERHALHKGIIADVLGQSTPVSKPVAHLLGGGTASGKSTLRNSGKLQIPKNISKVDTDEIREHLPEYQDGVDRELPGAAMYCHGESRDIASAAAKAVCKSHRNLLLDGTGDGSYDKLAKRVQHMKAEGMYIKADYCTVPLQTAIERSDKRAEETGRYVPHHAIQHNHAEVSRVVPQAMDDELFDELRLWDNSTDKPRLVMSQVHGDTIIHDHDLWKQFVAKAYPNHKGSHSAS